MNKFNDNIRIQFRDGSEDLINGCFATIVRGCLEVEGLGRTVYYPLDTISRFDVWPMALHIDEPLDPSELSPGGGPDGA